MNDRSKTIDLPPQKESATNLVKQENIIQELETEPTLRHTRLLKQVRAMIPKKSRHPKEQNSR
jgi:hypothetical protein